MNERSQPEPKRAPPRRQRDPSHDGDIPVRRDPERNDHPGQPQPPERRP